MLLNIKMTPFKALYGYVCLTPLNWSDPLVRMEVSRRMIEEMKNQMSGIKKDI